MASHAHELGHVHELGHAEHNPIAHVASVRLLVTVFVALVALTILTVWQGTQLELGSFELLVVLGIATIKAALVIAFFMHLRYDKPLNAFAFLFSLFFVAVFLGLTIADAWSYRPDVDAMDYKNASQK
jgi:cytochrome c oxidase subunit 4